jgi:hypothetical protein
MGTGDSDGWNHADTQAFVRRVTPKGLRALMDPHHLLWRDFDDPDAIRRLILDDYLMTDPDGFEAVADEAVALGHIEKRLNARGEVEYRIRKHR